MLPAAALAVAAWHLSWLFTANASRWHSGQAEKFGGPQRIALILRFIALFVSYPRTVGDTV